MSYRLDIGEICAPGPSFVPFLSGGLLIFLACLFLIRSFFLPVNADWRRGFFEGLKWYKSATVVLALFVYVLLLPTVGYLAMTFLFIFLLGRLVEPIELRKLLAASVLSTVLSYLFFGVWLGCQLPKGLSPL